MYGNVELTRDISVNGSVNLNLNNIKSFKTHDFADASIKGYACCIQIRIIYYQDFNVTCNLLCSIRRVALLKQIS